MAIAPPPPVIRYSYANAKEVHIEVYKMCIIDQMNKGVEGMELICSKALRMADESVATLHNEFRIARAETGGSRAD